MENYEMYKKTKKEAKKVVSDAKCKAYIDLYNRLGTREGEKDNFKVAKIRERKSRDFDHFKCIKSDGKKVLVKDNDIKERWREYFSVLLNKDCIGDIRTIEDTSLAKHTFFSTISVVEVRIALKQMKTGKATGPDDIPIETRKYFGEVGEIWLAKLFNKI